MEINRWWDNDPDEIYWLEITERDDLGKDLNSPQKGDNNQEVPGYYLMNAIRDGEIVFHYHKISKAVEAISKASGSIKTDTVHWGARGTTARRNTIRPYDRPGWRLDLKDFHRILPIVTLEQLRNSEEKIREIREKLRNQYHGKLYFPFQLSDTRPLRPDQAYLTKLPKDIVDLFPALRKAVQEMQSVSHIGEPVTASEQKEALQDDSNGEKQSPTLSNLATTQRKKIDNEPLAPIQEAHIDELIAEIGRHLLIDEKVVRRIYRALLAGHIILTGPPGTGKTVLARIIPEILWRANTTESASALTAYTTQLVIATDEWSVHTLIGGIEPKTENGQVTYHVRYGHLTEAIRKNWSDHPTEQKLWGEQRMSIYAGSYLNGGKKEEFRGLWLIIDEFNRAPIDLALGEALTTLSSGSHETLNVFTDMGYEPLKIPRDFRIIGTLNSFDRNFLNRISEALKRRFSFIDIEPPTRQKRDAEQAIVLNKALERVVYLNPRAIKVSSPNGVRAFSWEGIVEITSGERSYSRVWLDPMHPFHNTFELAWRIFEVIRIYRKLGTAQAIALIQQVLIAGLTQTLNDQHQWMEALDEAFSDTIADQLQVLLPDELQVLYWYIRRPSDADFRNRFNDHLINLRETEDRFNRQLEALGDVIDEQGKAILEEEELENLETDTTARLDEGRLDQIFQLGRDNLKLPLQLFSHRLRAFRAERGL